MLYNIQKKLFSRLYTSIYIKKEKKEKRMKTNFIYKQLDEYQSSACFAKATR